MSGLDLAEMDSSDMLDVLHFMLEEDMFVGSAAEIESRSKTRKYIYEEMYEREYMYGVSLEHDSSVRSASGLDVYPEDGLMSDEIIVPFNPDEEPMQKTRKPYIPPTDFNPSSTLPFGTVLDGPLG